MAPLASKLPLLLAALLLGASPAGAQEGGAGPAGVPAPSLESAPKPPDLSKPPLSRKEQIEKACEAEALEIRLLDVAGPPRKGEAAPGSAEKRGKDAQSVANTLGAGVESEADDAGQTVARKRGKTTKAKCRADVGRVLSRFPGASVAPTTAERVEILRQRRDAMIPEGLRKKPADASLAAKAFDGGAFGKLAPMPSAVSAGAGTASGRTPPPGGYGTSRPLLAQYKNALSLAPAPPPVTVAAPSYGERFLRGFSEAYSSASTYADDSYASVKASLGEAQDWVTGVARSVRNRFYSGIEMIQGYGYKFIHAGRQTNWGTKPLVDGLRAIAAYMKGTGKAQTDLAVGDLSSANGGKLGGHASHQTGRDVDIGFYMTESGSGKPVDTMNFVRFTGGRDGLSGDNGGRAVRFDAERNWMLVQAILANPDPEFKPTHIFIANHLRAAVLAAGANSPERERAAALMTYWPGHDNHLHLRVQ